MTDDAMENITTCEQQRRAQVIENLDFRMLGLPTSINLASTREFQLELIEVCFPAIILKPTLGNKVTQRIQC